MKIKMKKQIGVEDIGKISEGRFKEVKEMFDREGKFTKNLNFVLTNNNR